MDRFLKVRSVNRFINFFSKIKNLLFCKAIRDGMVMALPIFLIGSFAVMFNNLPFVPYQDFIHNFFNGIFYSFFTFIQSATFGILSVYITLTISLALLKNLTYSTTVQIGAGLSALISFFIFAGIGSQEFNIGMLAGKGMFAAINAGFWITWLYCSIEKLFGSRLKFYSDGSDSVFTSAIKTLLPLIITVCFSTIINLIICKGFKVNGINDAFIKLCNLIFRNLGRCFGSGILFLFLVHFLWFLGIHGNNVMEGVAEGIFSYDGASIFSKPLFDVFSLMGGSGSTWCLLIALLIFANRKRDKKLEYAALLPSIFNINELMIFGLPIIFNPVYLIPFILTPIVSYCITVLFYELGVLTQINPVDWTTPLFFSGYVATGTYKGALVQLLNLVVGTGIYMPFVILSDYLKDEGLKDNLDALVKQMKESERSTIPVKLTGFNTGPSLLANSLSIELEAAIKNREVKLFYQPQYNEKNECIGVESLMRWDHPVLGIIYPPLVFKLAEENGILESVERYVFETAFLNVDRIQKCLGNSVKISINVTGRTIQSEEFRTFLLDIMNFYRFDKKVICIEITEQSALDITDEFMEELRKLKDAGYSLAIDDFSMGHTSIAYLKTSLFDEVKLDGSLVKDMLQNERCKDIIKSISYLSESLYFTILAEYVETEDQKNELEKLGCKQYQGYLYYPAVSIETLENLAQGK